MQKYASAFMSLDDAESLQRVDEETRGAVHLFAFYVWNGTLCFMGGRTFELFRAFDYLDRLQDGELLRDLFTVYLANLGDGTAPDFDPWGPIDRARNWLKAQLKPRYRLSPALSTSELDAAALTPPWKQGLLRLLGELAQKDGALWPGLVEAPLVHLEEAGGTAFQTAVSIYLNNLEIGFAGEVVNHPAARGRVARWFSREAPGAPLAAWETELV